jgi:hypothetical protein
MISPHPLAGVRRAAVAVTLSVLAASACSDAGIPRGVDPVASASIVATVPPRIGREGCDRGSPIEEIDGGLELEGRVAGDREKLWALFATTALRSGEPVDVRWRIGGDRSMRVTLVGPNDRVAPAPPPRPEASTGWDRPGEPWVGAITFPQAGCWRVVVERARIRGELWIEVE